MWRFALAVFLLAGYLRAAPPAAPVVPAASQPSANFDIEKATDAWLATIPPEVKAKSDAYFEGGYWLILWDFLYGVGIALLLLETGVSAGMRDFAEKLTRSRRLQTFCYWLEYLPLTSILAFPLTVYEGYFREHRYGLSNQNFGQWMRDELVGLAIAALVGGLAYVAIMMTIRRAPRTWHVWGSLISILFLALAIVIEPVYLAPLFNKYTPLGNVPIKNQILSLAKANGIEATDVYEMDASRQSKRVSANVSGMFGTERITLNDNLLNRCSPAAVLATMGHEMGHYVMHHILYGFAFGAAVAICFFAVLRSLLDRLLARFGPRWQIRGVDDVAVTPLAALIVLCFGFVLTPVSNSFTRAQEYEADLYGLNASRQPDGEAEVDLLLGEYRKLDPSPLEELLFYDHPSGRTRIYAAMRWKAQNLCLFDPSLPCLSSRK